MTRLPLLFASLVSASLLFCCSKSADDTSIVPTTTDTTVPDVYKKLYGATSITSDGTYITIKSTGVPDHKSIYHASASGLYENFSGKTFGGYTFIKNPNSIVSQSLTFKIPLKPVVAANHAATPLGAIGVALNGVPIFNQYAGPNQPLTNEVMSFDQYWGHPQGTGQYHYHVEPLYLTNVKASKSALMGFLLDGFPGLWPAGKQRYRYQRHAGCLPRPYPRHRRLPQRHLSLPHYGC